MTLLFSDNRRSSSQSDTDRGATGASSSRPSTSSKPARAQKRPSSSASSKATTEFESAVIAHLESKGKKTTNESFGEYVGRQLEELPKLVQAKVRGDIMELLTNAIVDSEPGT